MNTKTKLIIPAVAIAAVAGAVALGTSNNAEAAKEGKVKCYGVAKAGQNDCGNVSGTHGCAGQAKADNLWDEWKYKSEAECAELKGTTTPVKPE